MTEIATPAAPAATPAAPAAAPATPAAATPAAGFLSSPAAPPVETPATPGTPAVRPSFFAPDYHADGKFKEGWADNLRQAGFERLANKGALAPDEATFLRSLDDTLGMVGKKGLAVPTAASTEAEIADFRRAFGVPDDPAAYSLKPETLPDGVSWDDAGAGEFASILHKHHAPAGLAKDLGAMWAQQQAKNLADGKAGFEARINDLSAEAAKVFGKEWGDDVDSRKQANIDFVKSRGLNLEDPVLRAALSHPDIVRMVDAARLSLREAPLPGVDAGVFTGSAGPREQAFAIMQSDPQWERKPDVAKRVNDLHALHAQQAKSKGGRR